MSLTSYLPPAAAGRFFMGITGILTRDLGQNFSVCFDLVPLIGKTECAHAASVFRDL